MILLYHKCIFVLVWLFCMCFYLHRGYHIVYYLMKQFFFSSDMTLGKISQYMLFWDKFHDRPCWCAASVIHVKFVLVLKSVWLFWRSCIYRNSFHDWNSKLLPFCLICSCFTSSLLGIPLMQFQPWSNLLVTQNQMGQERTRGQARNAVTLGDEQNRGNGEQRKINCS